MKSSKEASIKAIWGRTKVINGTLLKGWSRFAFFAFFFSNQSRDGRGFHASV